MIAIRELALGEQLAAVQCFAVTEWYKQASSATKVQPVAECHAVELQTLINMLALQPVDGPAAGAEMENCKPLMVKDAMMDLLVFLRLPQVMELMAQNQMARLGANLTALVLDLTAEMKL